MRTVITLMVFVASVASATATVPRLTEQRKMESMYIPSAPLPTTRLDPMDILKWLKQTTIVMDPTGEGVNFQIVLSGTDITDWDYSDHGIAQLSSPVVQKVNVSDYLQVLARYAGWTLDITEDSVRILIDTNQKTSNQSIEPTGDTRAGHFD